MADAAFIINLFDLGGNSVSKNRALPATALSRSRAIIIASLVLPTLRTAQDVHSARRSDGAVLALPLRESTFQRLEPANELSGLSPKMAPTNLCYVVGQEHVLTALANGLSLGRFIMLIFFPAPVASEKPLSPDAGEGAKLRNRHYRDAVRRVHNCREIEQGRFVDLIEIDAARAPKLKIPATCWITSSTLRRWSFQSLSDRRSAYAVAPQLYALLKTLEEPPEHVKFLLATPIHRNCR